MFVDDGIFFIVGCIGVGKLSIFDVVCFGFYGGVLCYDGGEKCLCSDYCELDDIFEVVVEFSMLVGWFCVMRFLEYLCLVKCGGGMMK